jgi:hypothetical protein
VAEPFRLAPVRRRSDLWFSSWGRGPKFSTSPNSGTDGDFLAPSSDFGSYGEPGRFCQVWRPTLDRKGFVRRVVSFRFCFFAPRADDGLSPVGPFFGVGDGRSRSRPVGDVPPRLAVGSPLVVAGGGHSGADCDLRRACW